MFVTGQTQPCALEVDGWLALRRGVGVHGGVRGCKIDGVGSGKEHTLLLAAIVHDPPRRKVCVCSCEPELGCSSGSRVSARR